MISNKLALQYYTVVYHYTTELNKEKHRVKVGSARRLAASAHDAALQRIKEQITAANSADPFEILHVEDVSKHCETGLKGESLSKLRQLEQTWLHANMKNKGMWVPSASEKSEWFFGQDVDDVVETSVRLINEYTKGSTMLNTYPPHKFQQEAIDKAVNYFAKDGTDFLLDCVMRFGKSFTSYKICKERGHKRILVITGRPKVKNGWRDDLDHVDFDGWQFIDSQTVKGARFFEDPSGLFDTPEAEVIFASFQGGKRNDSRIANVMDQEIDCVIIDEAHAYMSVSAMEFVKNLKAKEKIWVSGTPFKAYESGMFDGETDTYRFTLQDLLREKKRVEAKLAAGEECDFIELRYLDFPNIQFVVAEYPEFEVNEIYNEQGLSMKALLSSNAGVPNYPNEVNGLLDSLLSTTHRSPFTLGGREVKYPVDPKHVWMAVPAGKDDSQTESVAAATTLESAINKHPVFGPKFSPLAIRGDKDQDDVNRHIMFAKHEGKGSIEISCRSLNTGTKFPDINSVVWLNETSSAAEFWQTNGRAIQPQEGKESITIICYSIEMVVNMANKLVEYSDKGQGHNALMQEFLTMMPVYVAEGPRVRSIDIEEVYEQLTTKGSVTKSFTDREVLSKHFDEIVRNNLQFFQNIPDVNSDKEPTNVKLFNTGVKGKNSITTNNTPMTQQEKDAVKEAQKKVREFLKLIGSVMAASLLYRETLITSTDDLENVDEDLIDSELYPGTKEILTTLIDSGALNTGILDRKISAFYNVALKDKTNG